MKAYPLKIENVGEDTYMLMSRGHHDFKDFMDAVKEAHPSWSMGQPEHHWMKAVPTRRDGYQCIYSVCEPNIKGAFPATYCFESYGEERWKYE